MWHSLLRSKVIFLLSLLFLWHFLPLACVNLLSITKDLLIDGSPQIQQMRVEIRRIDDQSSIVAHEKGDSCSETLSEAPVLLANCSRTCINVFHVGLHYRQFKVVNNSSDSVMSQENSWRSPGEAMAYSVPDFRAFEHPFFIVIIAMRRYHIWSNAWSTVQRNKTRSIWNRAEASNFSPWWRVQADQQWVHELLWVTHS